MPVACVPLGSSSGLSLGRVGAATCPGLSGLVAPHSSHGPLKALEQLLGEVLVCARRELGGGGGCPAPGEGDGVGTGAAALVPGERPLFPAVRTGVDKEGQGKLLCTGPHRARAGRALDTQPWPLDIRGAGLGWAGW